MSAERHDFALRILNTHSVYDDKEGGGVKRLVGPIVLYIGWRWGITGAPYNLGWSWQWQNRCSPKNNTAWTSLCYEQNKFSISCQPTARQTLPQVKCPRGAKLPDAGLRMPHLRLTLHSVQWPLTLTIPKTICIDGFRLYSMVQQCLRWHVLPYCQSSVRPPLWWEFSRFVRTKEMRLKDSNNNKPNKLNNMWYVFWIKIKPH